jgi:putative ABC transport system permease protein
LWNNCYTYFLLKKGAKQSVFESELMEEVKNHAGPQIKTNFGISLEQLLAAGNRYGYLLQPLTSIHFYSHLDNEIEPNGDIKYIYIFSAIAIAILLIACINFVNLATARSERRAKEVGVRKTLGSTRAYLIRQFISESVLMSLAAVVLAVGIVELLLPLFNDLSNKKVSLHLFSDPMSIPLLICFAVMVGLVAGSYPAFYLSSFRPVEILRSETKKRGRKSVLRNGLVVFQFAISIALFIGTFVIYAQMRYVQTKELGFNKEATIVINKVGDLSIQVKSFEDELKVSEGIISLTNSTSIPGDRTGDGAYRFADASTDQYQDLRNMSCDYDFAETYQLNVAEGRFFSMEHPSDSEGVVVNESVEKVLGARNIVGRYLVTTGSTPGILKKVQIIGVVKDFNFESLHEPIRPLVLSLLPASRYPGRFVTIRLAQGDHLSAISSIENAWKKYAGGEEFSFNFLDNNLQKLYMADQRASKIAGIFSTLAIFIACLGLLGLAAFITEQSTKEIGIRKVLGASVPEVIGLLSAQFAKWVLIANVVAWPLAYYIMDNWLQNFAYRTDMSIWIFVGSGILALVIALATVSTHAIKAATANPIESLRYE